MTSQAKKRSMLPAAMPSRVGAVYRSAAVASHMVMVDDDGLNSNFCRSLNQEHVHHRIRLVRLQSRQLCLMAPALNSLLKRV